MRSTSSHLRPVLRLLGFALVVVAAVLAASWFGTFLETTALGGSGSDVEPPVALGELKWAIPSLLAGLVLLVVTTRRRQLLSLSLSGPADDR